MGCCASSTGKTREPDGSSSDHPPDDDHHHLSDNRPPPNLALMSSVRTLRSHLEMSPPSTPFHPHHRPDEAEILYPINPRYVPSSNPRPSRYNVGNSQIAAFDHDGIDRTFVDLSTTTFNFSKEVQFGGGGERTPSISSIRLGGSDRWSIDSPTPIPLAEIWKRREPHHPPLSAVDMWTAGGRRLNKRERGNNWDPPEDEFSDTSSCGNTSREMSEKMPRRVTFKDMPRRKENVFDDGPGHRRGATQRVARSRVGGWSPPEVSRSFDDGMFSGMGFARERVDGSVRGRVRDSSTKNDDVSMRNWLRNEYDPANDLLSMEGFIFF